MKALTLTQPWATLVAIGAKRIETRSWKTAYRGPIAIHAAKTFPKWAKETAREPEFARALGDTILPLGFVICTCILKNVLPVEVADNRSNVSGVSLPPLSEQERAFGDYAPGRFAWILENPMPVSPVQYAKGALGLWEWS